MSEVKNTWNGFAEGDKIVMLVETAGDTADGDEVVFSIGTLATILAIRDFGAQGMGVDVLIGSEGRSIINSFDDADFKANGPSFRKAG